MLIKNQLHSLSGSASSPPWPWRKLRGRSWLLKVCSLWAQTIHGHFRPYSTIPRRRKLPSLVRSASSPPCPLRKLRGRSWLLDGVRNIFLLKYAQIKLHIQKIWSSLTANSDNLVKFTLTHQASANYNNFMIYIPIRIFLFGCLSLVNS